MPFSLEPAGSACKKAMIREIKIYVYAKGQT